MMSKDTRAVPSINLLSHEMAFTAYTLPRLQITRTAAAQFSQEKKPSPIIYRKARRSTINGKMATLNIAKFKSYVNAKKEGHEVQTPSTNQTCRFGEPWCTKIKSALQSFALVIKSLLAETPVTILRISKAPETCNPLGQ